MEEKAKSIVGLDKLEHEIEEAVLHQLNSLLKNLIVPRKSKIQPKTL